MIEKETYKGIEFVRISNLPKEQSESIKASFPKEKIIKILRDEVILGDCIQYHEYMEWLKEHYALYQEFTFHKADQKFVQPLNLTFK